jgi:sugar phosphate isomerase/epimerase
MKESNMHNGSIKFSMAMSPFPSVFAPLVFAGKLEEGMRNLSRAGFHGVEISLRCCDDIDVAQLQETLDQLHLSISAFATGRMCLEEAYCLCDPRQDHHDKAWERLKDIVRLAARFHAPVIIGGIRGKLSGDPLQREQQRTQLVEILRDCAGLASEMGTHLLLEPINRYETNIMNSAQDALDLAEEMDCPGVKILLDTFHMNIEEVDFTETIQRVGDLLGYMHFADNNRLAPGQGHIPFPVILDALAKIHYSGFISAEILPLPDDESALHLTGQYLNSLVIGTPLPKKQKGSNHG